MDQKPDGEAAEPRREAVTQISDNLVASPPSPFDSKASASAIIEDARSIQALLKTYEENTRRLKADVQEFVIREVQEESKFRSLSVAVAQEELTALQNTEFIKFSRDYAEEGVASEEVMPTSRMNGVDHPLAASAAGGARLASEEVMWARRDHPWAPDNGIALKAYDDVREVLLGWRGRTAVSDRNFCALCHDLFGGEEDGVGFCCFFNGLLYSPPPLGSAECVFAASETLVDCFWDSLKAGLGNDAPQRTIAAAVHAYSTFVATSSSQTAAQLTQHLWQSSKPSRDGFRDGAAETVMDNFTPQLVGDAHDCLAVVRPGRLRNTQTFRGFFMRGRLVAVEHIGPQVDVLRLLCSTASREGATADIPANGAERERERIVATFHHLAAFACNADGVPLRNAVMTLGIAPERLPGEGGAAVPHTNGVVLGVRPIVPSLPFFWHFSWAEICSLGQMLADPSSSGVVSVAFKCTRLSVAALAPIDALSAQYFPLLNTQAARALSKDGARAALCEEAPVVFDPPVHSSPSLSPRDEEPSSSSSTPARVAGAVALVSTVAATAAFLLRRK